MTSTTGPDTPRYQLIDTWLDGNPAIAAFDQAEIDALQNGLQDGIAEIERAIKDAPTPARPTLGQGGIHYALHTALSKLKAISDKLPH
jgi:hypothetical protein